MLNPYRPEPGFKGSAGPRHCVDAWGIWNMRRVFIGLMVAAVAAIGFGSVAASASANKLQTFGTGTVTATGSDSATIVNGAGEYGGVYINSRSQSPKLLSAVSLSFVPNGGG